MIISSFQQAAHLVLRRVQDTHMGRTLGEVNTLSRIFDFPLVNCNALVEFSAANMSLDALRGITYLTFVNACVNLRRNNFDPLRFFFPMVTNYRVLSSACPATRADQDRPPHPAAGRLHLDILWWTAGAETSERGVYRRAFRARSSRLPSLPQVSR